MSNPLHPSETPEPSAAAMPSWFAALLRPRTALPQLLREECESSALLYTALAGIALLLAGANTEVLINPVRVAVVLFFCLVAGPVLGWFVLYTLAALLTWTGELFGGRGISEPVKGAVGYASLPLVPAGCLALFLSGTRAAGWIVFAAWLYGLGLLVQGQAAAQQFSLVRAAGSLVVAALAVVVPGALLLFFYAFLLMHSR